MKLDHRPYIPNISPIYISVYTNRRTYFLQLHRQSVGLRLCVNLPMRPFVSVSVPQLPSRPSVFLFACGVFQQQRKAISVGIFSAYSPRPPVVLSSVHLSLSLSVCLSLSISLSSLCLSLSMCVTVSLSLSVRNVFSAVLRSTVL